MARPPLPDPAGPPDPSMDDILASIRKILSEEETAHPEPDGVLMLEPSMLVSEPAPNPPAAETKPMSDPTPEPAPPAPSASAGEPASLVAPEAAAAAASSVGTLVRRIAAERGSAVSRGGPTIEDLVRDEIRPLLKEWLDAHLPQMVERLVRVEIERVVGRIGT